jgi:hypothetical protein
MPIEVERLVATLEARLDKYEKSLNKAFNTTDKQFKRIEDRGTRMEKHLASLGKNIFTGLVGGATAALAPILSVSAAINTAKAALKEFGDIADSSKAAGLDSEFFQGIAYQASLVGVAFDQSADALAFYNKNVGLAAAEKGKLYTQLKALNPELLKNIGLTTSQEERVRLAADAISRESDSARRAALATVLFGESGAKLADAFSTGSKGIDQTAAAAAKLGIIVDRELIARADQLGDEFDTATKILDLQFKEVLIELAPLLISTANAIAELIKQARELGKNLPPLGSLLMMVPGMSGVGMGMNAADMARQAGTSMDAFKKPVEITVPVGKKPQSTGYAAPGADERAAKALREADAVKKLISQLQFEKDLIGKSQLEQKKMNALRDAGTAATAAQRGQIAYLTEQIYAEQSHLDLMQASWEKIGDIGVSAMQRLTDAMEDGQIEGKELLDILLDVLSQATQFLGSQSGGSGQSVFQQILGMLGIGKSTSSAFTGGWGSSGFGGKRAAGGPVSAGKAYVVGEQRPELFVPSTAGRIVPRVPGGDAGMKVNVMNYGARVQTQQRSGPNGPELDVIVDQMVAQKLSQPGSRSYRALRQVHGTSQPLTER